MIDYLLYTEPVEKKDIRSLSVRAFVVNEDPDLTAHLLRAWCALREQETDDPIPGFVPHDNAQCDARYQFFMAIYEKALGYEPDEGCEPDWPENIFLPKWFVRQIAIIMGQKDKAGMRMMRELDTEMTRDLHNLTKEQFKSKHGFVHGGYTKRETAQ